jgi:hypothetical protein
MNARAVTWPIVEGHVQSVQVKPRFANVIYNYVYRKKHYTGRTLSFILRGSIAEREHILDTYHPKMKVSVHVNPNVAEQSVLEVRGPVLEYIQLNLFVITALSVCAIIVAALFRNECSRKGNRSKKRTETTSSVFERAPRARKGE